MTIKALLIDSGRVLNRPKTGHWMMTPQFFDYVNKKGFYSFSKKKRKKAFGAGMAYLGQVSHMASLEEEVDHFSHYYRRVFESLGMFLPDEHFLALAKDMVYDRHKYVFYSDVKAVIADLSRAYDLALVSDAWPSLRGVFQEAGYDGYFKGFIVSTEIGVAKPHPDMYLKTMACVGHQPQACAFVDDRKANCQGARDQGVLLTYLLCRHPLAYLYHKLTCKDHRVVRNFYQIYEDLKKN